MVQRFGAALNLNVHVHAPVLDGVFTLDVMRAATFHGAEPPSHEEAGRGPPLVADLEGVPPEVRHETALAGVDGDV